HRQQNCRGEHAQVAVQRTNFEQVGLQRPVDQHHQRQQRQRKQVRVAVQGSHHADVHCTAPPPMLAATRFSFVSRSPRSSALTCPSCSTSTRLHKPSSSSSSLL